MKTSSVLVATLLVLFVNSLAWPQTATTPPQQTFEISPDVLKKMLLENNLQIQRELLTVKDAWDQVSYYRTSLWPGANLRMSSPSLGSAFLSSVQFLLPFLIPSNWFNFKASKKAFEAEKLMYQIVELNTYQSALNLYYNTLSEQMTTAVYQELYEQLRDIAEIKVKQSKSGSFDINDIRQAEGKRDQMLATASDYKLLSDQSTAYMRQALNLPITASWTLKSTGIDVDPIPGEDKTTPEAINAALVEALKAGPETQQFVSMVSQNKFLAGAADWSFLNLADATASSNNGNVNLGNTTGGVGAGFGLNYFPARSLAHRKVEEVRKDFEKYRGNVLASLEVAYMSLVQAKIKYAASLSAEENFRSVVHYRLEQFKQGGTWTDLETAINDLTANAPARIAGQLNVNLQRLALHRAFLTGPFRGINGCKNAQVPKKKMNIDEMCKAQ